MMTNMWPLAIQPYAVQLEALKRSQGRKHFAYFMEMGLGKTALILAEYVSLVQQGLVDNLLVICPNSLKGVWLDEMDKVGFPPNITRGAWPNTMHWLNSPGTSILIQESVIVMNYEACITNNGNLFMTKFLSQSRTMLVIDESTQIKNPRARRTRALIGACKSATYVRLLSGQPIVQGPHDLWSQLRCLNEFSGLNYYVFRNIFCQMGGFMGKQVMGANPGQVATLNGILSRVSFRAKKDEWLDLPKQIYTTRNVTMTKEQEKHYKQMKEFLLTMIANQEIDAQMVVTQMLKLQQISSGFIIDAKHEVHDIPGGNPKLALLDEIMEEASGKTLIFTHFRASTRNVVNHLIKLEPAVIEGGMTPEELRAQRDRFDKETQCRVLVCQVQTGKYGLTLLGGPGEDRCATTVFYENSFSLDSRIQAEARNHRIGQDKPVLYIDLPASDIERVVVRALHKKQDVATAIIDYAAAA
jgi:SNF2 family DNA or RNA helicase